MSVSVIDALAKTPGTQRKRQDALNEIGKYIVDKAVHIHRDMGPGLSESVYEVILAHQMLQQGLKVERQRAIPIEYCGIRFDEGWHSSYSQSPY